MNLEFPGVQAGFRKSRGTTNQIANIQWIIQKARESQKKTSTFALLTTPKLLTVWIKKQTNKKKTLENSERDGNTRSPDLHLTNLYADQETITGHGTIDWLQIRKGVHQGYILSPCLFNLYAEHIMQNAGLVKKQ